jgi:hypothetical protein
VLTTRCSRQLCGICTLSTETNIEFQGQSGSAIWAVRGSWRNIAITLIDSGRGSQCNCLTTSTTLANGCCSQGELPFPSNRLFLSLVRQGEGVDISSEHHAINHEWAIVEEPFRIVVLPHGRTRVGVQGV